jgi:hypothetical protein
MNGYFASNCKLMDEESTAVRDSAGNNQLMGEEYTAGMGFRRELPAH